MNVPLGRDALVPKWPRLQQDARSEVVTVASCSGWTMREVIVGLSGAYSLGPFPVTEQRERCRKNIQVGNSVIRHRMYGVSLGPHSR